MAVPPGAMTVMAQGAASMGQRFRLVILWSRRSLPWLHRRVISFSIPAGSVGTEKRTPSSSRVHETGPLSGW